jgi:hypothetical protein
MKKLCNVLASFYSSTNTATELQSRLIWGKWNMGTKCCSGNFKGRGYVGDLDVVRTDFDDKTNLWEIWYERSDWIEVAQDKTLWIR